MQQLFWIDAQRHVWPERAMQLADGFDLDLWFEHAGFEFDRVEAIPCPHLLDLRYKRFGRERFAIFIVACVGLFPAAAGLLVEGVGGERHGVSHAPADKVADGLTDGFSDQVKTCDLDRGEGAGRGVQRVFTRDEPGLGMIGSRLRR